MSDDSTSSGSYRIEPLKGEVNYQTWKVQMMDILNELELWEYVDGSKPFPDDKTQQPGWKKKDAKALRAIRLRLANDIISDVRDAETAKEAWDSLAQTYQPAGLLGIAEVRRKLFALTFPRPSLSLR